jgi:NAD(P)-dependent dehydrogenase (short-subunit alcohol dehydrogenase family)
VSAACSGRSRITSEIADRFSPVRQRAEIKALPTVRPRNMIARLGGKGCAAIVTGGDSGIGRAVCIAYAWEGADVLISCLSEDEDARETARWVEKAGRKAVLVRGDIGDEKHCNDLVERAMREFGRLDILVNNAAFQRTHEKLADFSREEIETTFRTNIESMFFLAKAAAAKMKPGSSIINTTSIQADDPSPQLLAWSRARPDLDAVDSLDDVGRENLEVWQQHAAQPSRPAGGAGACLRVSRFERSHVRHRCDPCRQRRQADALMIAVEQIALTKDAKALALHGRHLPWVPEIMLSKPKQAVRQPLAPTRRRAAFEIPACIRHELIEQAAYFRAERRGFVPGHEIADWLAAEQEVDALLRERYL